MHGAVAVALALRRSPVIVTINSIVLIFSINCLWKNLSNTSTTVRHFCGTFRHCSVGRVAHIIALCCRFLGGGGASFTPPPPPPAAHLHLKIKVTSSSARAMPEQGIRAVHSPGEGKGMDGGAFGLCHADDANKWFVFWYQRIRYLGIYSKSANYCSNNSVTAGVFVFLAASLLLKCYLPPVPPPPPPPDQIPRLPLSIHAVRGNIKMSRSMTIYYTVSIAENIPSVCVAIIRLVD